MIEPALTLLLGTMLAAAIALAGYTEWLWVGFAAAATCAQTTSGGRGLARVAGAITSTTPGNARSAKGTVQDAQRSQ
jgi:hypothetical protein